MDEKNVRSYTVSSPKLGYSKKFTFFTLFRYSSSIDYILLICGIIFAFLQGSSGSLSSVTFKELTDALITGQEKWENGNFDSEEFRNQAMKAIYKYFTFGCFVFILAFFSSFITVIFLPLPIGTYLNCRQNWEWFDAHNCGELTTRMSDGLERVRDGMGDKIGALISYISTFICGLTIAFCYSWEMTLIMLCLTPIYLIPIVGSYKLMSMVVPKEQKAYSDAGSTAEEVISGIRTVISFNGQNKEINRYTSHLDRGMRYGLRRAYLTTFGVALLAFALFTAMAVAFWFGAKMVVSGVITPGTTFAVFWAITGAVYAIAQAAPHIPAFLACHSAAAPIFEIIDREPSINSGSTGGQFLTKVSGEVHFKNLRFTYPNRREVQVLKGVSIEIKPGENIAFVGHSGCGKSTIASLLLRCYDPVHGEIQIDGTNIAALNVTHLRNIVGIVSQEPLLFDETVENNIRLGAPDIRDDEIEHYCRMSNAHSFIAQLPNGYKTFIGNGGVQLSGGQKQRIAIARTLARKPSILILDEATSALDTDSEVLVQQALENAKHGRTTITIAHRLTTIRNCDRIYVFENGEIVEIGNHDELLMSDGIYAKLVRVQELETRTPEDAAIDDEFLELAAKRSSVDMLENRAKLSKKLSKAFSLTAERIDADLTSGEPSGLLEILQFARPEWCYLLLALLLSALRGLTFPIFSVIYGRMFQTLSSGTDNEKMENAKLNAIYFTLLGLGSGIVTMLAGCLLGYVGERVTRRMRIRMFSNILRQDGDYFDKPEHAPGRLTIRLATDAPNIRAAIDQRLADVIQGISAIICATSLGFSFGAEMAPIGVLTAGTLLILQVVVAQFLKKRGEKDAVNAEEPSRLATEAIEQYRTVQHLTRELHFVSRFESGMSDIHRRSVRRGIVQSLSYAMAVSYTFLNFAIAYRYGVELVVRQILSPFKIFQVIESLNSASSSLLAFGTYIPEYIRARISAALVFRMLREKPRIDSMRDDGRSVRLSGAVALSNVYFSYPGSRRVMVLNGFSARVDCGKTLALVGASGCGKSTVIQLLERFYDPLAGAVTYDGEMATNLNLRVVREQISLVGQQPTLFNYSIRENIAYGMNDATHDEIVNAAKLANAHEFITKMPEGYDTVVGECGGRLSGGQKQRIAIARAIVRKPKILLLDEATSALDAESEKLVQEALDKAKQGRTCIVIAHRLSTIRGADMIAVVKEGKIVEKGTHAQLVALAGIYSEMVQKSTI